MIRDSFVNSKQDINMKRRQFLKKAGAAALAEADLKKVNKVQSPFLRGFFLATIELPF